MIDNTQTQSPVQPVELSSGDNPQDPDDTLLRSPSKADAFAIHQLIKQCPPLDLNSIYTYLLLGEHFSATCVLAQGHEGPDGFVSAYIPPQSPDVLFIWQVAVHERARGRKLGQRMLGHLLARPGLSALRFIHTTVGPDNAASRGMFAGLARALGAQTTETAFFESGLFGDSGHDDERLIRIGPLVLSPPDH